MGLLTKEELRRHEVLNLESKWSDYLRADESNIDLHPISYIDNKPSFHRSHVNYRPYEGNVVPSYISGGLTMYDRELRKMKESR